MIWFYCEDHDYYKNIGKLAEAYSLDDIFITPDEKELKNLLSLTSPTGVLAPYYPPAHLKNLFVVKHLKNKYGVLTSQEKRYGVPENEALEKRLGISVVESKITFKDVAGAHSLKKWSEDYINAENKGYKAKGIMFVGVPGAGKTFFVKAFAGELKRLLIALNLSAIMEKPNPIETLNSIFEYLESTGEKYIIWIDEIEKMIGNNSPEEKRILGRLLTVQNDLHTSTSEYKFDAIFLATANNINSILDTNPEMLRRGRWDELFFLNLPDFEMAEEVFRLYFKKEGIDLDSIKVPKGKSPLKMIDIIVQIETKYSLENEQSHKFPYTPAEIEQFAKKLKFLQLARGELSLDDIKETTRMIIPIIKSGKRGVSKMVGQKELFVEV